MKPSDPTTEPPVSNERQFSTEAECQQEAKRFSEAHPGIKSCAIPHGCSFGIGSMEYRFIHVRDIIAPSLDYYDIKSDSLDVLKKVYADYTSPGGGYTAIMAPSEDGGVDYRGERTARCIMANERAGTNARTRAAIGLIINPPFPNGHPNKRRLKRRTEKYLLLLAGVSLGLTLGPALKVLTRFLGKKR